MLKNKVAYITGGSKGIGYGIAESLLKHGMRVAITGRDQNALKEAADSLNYGDDHLLTLQSDVTSLEAEEAAIRKTVAHFGQLDVLVANAGVGYFGNIETLSAKEWQQTIDTNLTGVFNSVKAAIEPLKKSKGYIITVASLAGTNFFANGSAYNASKFGLVGFTQSIMLDLRPAHIKVTTIMPGSVATHFNNNTPGDADSWKIQPEDIGQIVVDLLKMHPRTLPSKVEVRPSQPAS